MKSRLVIDGALDTEAYAKLVEIAGLTPAELRQRAYDYVPDTLVQLKKWKRGDLVAQVFDSWATRRLRENDAAEQNRVGPISDEADPRRVTRSNEQLGPEILEKPMKKLTFAGVGSAFCGPDQYQTNAVVTVEEDSSKKHLLLDCGGDARFSLGDIDVKLPDVEGVYVSHLHADHVGGMEWLAFCTYFNPNLGRPKLFCDYTLMHRLWESTLRGGLDSIEGKVMTLTDYFDCQPIVSNGSFVWGDVEFTPVQTVHVMAGYQIVHSFGLMIATLSPGKPPRRIFFTSDTQFCPHQIRKFYDEAHLIFQDCETSEFKSGVHAHVSDLKTLPDEIKAKMWLMHYQDRGSEMHDWAKDAGFAGFVEKGQSFDLIG